ncbi:histidinol dehydrogenase [Flavobacterium gawalongense]|uniref:Histidinol dehydrogenase n=1 Tax=Flavobacterium gawalongense TaxID=2594432 RepID=A0A553BGI7_9FLAO|nr:histidinol dehydrogenase [Flavobacterium gawalongense]TRX00011.1 histidinol dehydrogenase [Flavobacterium gawalongense]TRX04759.1 histidinol dehydrogenase [Flavobacterium gawalongense]TRX07345.1 histidinol dehydrogenase [Flavobacterium gawalongense]TRX08362.1 histidinol dehydrogenase [Flavobacterium gawalongense]TRX24449.1 histidinol dehydrogenase [Flavobacterium gawalongense]
MNKIYNPKPETWSSILERPTKTVDDIEATVKEIFKEVQKKGDIAVAKYTSLFDGASIEKLEVSKAEIDEAIASISSELKEAIQLAKTNIKRFHSAQKTERVVVETIEGVNCWQEKRPIQKIGLYIPGGTAPLFSTVLMLAVPAKIAGCNEIVLCSPPDKNGTINPAILYAANLCGVTKILKVGGIQAIAGMTFGTETIPKVYKIFGPGNQFVTVAKQLATQFGVAIDMPAGPSELLIVADDTAVPAFVASDLLSQAEHGADSQVILVSTSKKLIDAVENEIQIQMDVLPRKTIAEKAIANSKLIYVENDTIALELINEYGPEHFIICSQYDDFYSNGIHNAGSVFIGNYTPESAGDYASGTNHTLPTNGYAKNYSGVNLDSFTKAMTFQKITEIGIQNIGKAIEIMAETEGLQAHKNAVTLRLKAIEDGK